MTENMKERDARLGFYRLSMLGKDSAYFEYPTEPDYFLHHFIGKPMKTSWTSPVVQAGGAAFSALGGTSTDEANNIAMHAGLDNFIGTGTANSETINSAFSADTQIARITIVPEPSSTLLLGAALLGVCS